MAKVGSPSSLPSQPNNSFNFITGDIIHLDRDQTNSTWLAATTSLGLLGPIVRAKIAILADYKVWANQTTLDEDDVLNGDLYKMISPYVTANLWVCSLSPPLVLMLIMLSVVAWSQKVPSENLWCRSSDP